MGSKGGDLIVSFGEMLIDFVPTESGVSLAEAPGFLKAPGGAPANVAIAVTRLGGKAAFLGKLGDDEFGHMLAGILKQNGVSVEGIKFDQGARTALAFVTLRADGEREFMFYRNPSADMLLTPDELNLDLIRSVCIIYPSLLLISSFYISLVSLISSCLYVYIYVYILLVLNLFKFHLIMFGCMMYVCVCEVCDVNLIMFVCITVIYVCVLYYVE